MLSLKEALINSTYSAMSLQVQYRLSVVFSFPLLFRIYIELHVLVLFTPFSFFLFSYLQVMFSVGVAVRSRFLLFVNKKLDRFYSFQHAIKWLSFVEFLYGFDDVTPQILHILYFAN